MAATLAVPTVALLLSACGAGEPSAVGSAPASTAPTPVATSGTPTTDGSPPSGRASDAGASAPLSLPATAHVHNLGVDPGTGEVLAATHEGLYVFRDGRPQRVGPAIDLMGFTVAGPGHYLGSGHPNPGVDLPEPVGLVETGDGGATWRVLSRAGQSDFHALVGTPGAVVGFDGVLRLSADGRSWSQGELSAPPRTLAMSPDGTVVLATTARGVQRSGDGGRSWQPVAGAPLLLLVDWAAGDAVAGVSPDGRVHLSADGGLTWQAAQARASAVQAMEASGAGDALVVRVATEDRVLSSAAGAAFVGG